MKEAIRWGILAPGSIARQFARGLQAIPDAELIAVGSRSIARADKFADEFNVPHRHGSYTDLANDPDVDVVYVATPHPFHKDCAILCMEAGKAVLCEKPLAVDAGQVREMIACARENRQFLMEAMWTRFTPVMVQVREWLARGVIGDPYILNADFGFRSVKSAESLEGRLFRPDLAGGALLDVGVYTIAMASMLFGTPSHISSQMYIGETGVDEQTGILLGYDAGEMALLSCAIRASTPHEAHITGAKGSIHIPRFWHATSATLKVTGRPEERLDMPFIGNGYEYEAMAVMECLRAGKLESDIMPLDESLSIAETMDIIRAQGGLEYPAFASVLTEVREETLSRKELLRTRAWEVEESPTDLGYQVVPGWPQIPADMVTGSVSGTAVDSQNRVYMVHRGREAPWLLCFDSDGKLLFTRDAPPIGRAHMMAVDADDLVWLSDDGNHIVFQLSEEGEVLQVIGEKGVAGNDEYHFDRQTDLDFGPNGEIYVCDGDGEGSNRRVVKYDSEGNFLLQWGREGTGPGEFAPPHAITVDDEGTVFVSDRNNWRVQVFDADGNLETVWPHLGRIYDVAPDGKGDYFVVDGKVGRITKVDRQGNVLGWFGVAGSGEGELSTAHSITFCPDEDIVVGHLDGRIQRFSKR